MVYMYSDESKVSEDRKQLFVNAFCKFIDRDVTRLSHPIDDVDRKAIEEYKYNMKMPIMVMYGIVDAEEATYNPINARRKN